MNPDAPFPHADGVELRVLHGPQAGSRLPLMPGAPYLIGSGDNCDVVLAGAQVEEEHAHIEVDGSHWSITPEEGRALRLDGLVCDANQSLAFGTAIALGRVKITVDLQSAEWPQDEALEPQPRPEPAPTAEENPATDEAPDATGAGAAMAAAPAPVAPPSRLGRRVLALAMFALAASASIALTAYAAWQATQPPESLSPPAAKTSPPPPPKAPPTPEVLMPDWVRKHGTNAHLMLEGGGERPWRVLGYVKQDSERQRLIDATRELPWPVEVAVSTEAERLNTVQRYASEQPPNGKLTVRWRESDTGNPAVRVVATNQALADEFIAKLQKDLRPLEPIDTEVLLPPAVRHRFMERLDVAGLGSRFTTIRTEPDLALTALLPQADVARWERMFADFTKEYGSVLSISAVIRTERDAIESRIRAVVAGAYPYVMTTSGQRVAPGGAIDGKTVIAVNAQEVVFSDGLRVRLRP